MMRIKDTDIISETVRFTLKKPERYMVALMSGMSAEDVLRHNQEVVMTLGRVWWRAQQIYSYNGYNGRGGVLC